MPETILTNARIVTRDAVIEGTLTLRGGRIASLVEGRSALPGAIDCEGDLLIPGLVDVHTDNLERQVLPRSNARWPGVSAYLSHDAQCIAAGVTTVLDALCLGDLGFDTERGQTFLEGVRDLDRLADAGVLKAEHFLHLRCEIPALDMPAALDSVADNPRVLMASLMDHSPGIGQYRDLTRYRAMRIKQTRMTETEVETRIGELLERRERLRRPQREWMLGRLAHRNLPLASHDDDTEAAIAENLADGIRISEFPVTMIAAKAARAGGMEVIAGAPNIVRGGSHSGNVNASDLIEAGVVDAFASDYVPASMLEAAWGLAARGTLPIPEAIALVTDRPARMARFADRGQLAPGLRADVARVKPFGALPVLRGVWVAGVRAG